MFRIGEHYCENPTILAPMAGVTDAPFRQLCRRFGAGLTVSEMMTADPSLWLSRKSVLRRHHHDEPGPRIVQIAGAEPELLANAARHNVDLGAQIIDINMGCPAKKVCKKAAGSALLRDEKKVSEILTAVVGAVDVPVTLKIRTGWDPDNRNGVAIARLAEEKGIQALAVHGRTRACKFNGDAEYDTIAAIVEAVSIPVFANGDIDSPHKARSVLEKTGAAAVMVGRAAQGRPWIFREINHFVSTGQLLPSPTLGEIQQTLHDHLRSLYNHYGETGGVRIARKHVGWYLDTLPKGHNQKKIFNHLESSDLQLSALNNYFNNLMTHREQAA